MRVAFGRGREGGSVPGGVLFIPGGGVGEFVVRFVVDFAAAPDSVAVLAKVLGEGDPVLVFRDVAKEVEVAVDAGGGGAQAGHDGRAGGVAEGGGAVGVFEQHAPAGQSINIGSLCLGMPSKTTNPVVQIVDGDEQDVRLFVLGKAGANQKQGA